MELKHPGKCSKFMATKKSKTSKKKKKYIIELTSLSTLFWAFFAFFLLSWIFILGILVGRGSLPASIKTISELREQINKLQSMIADNKKPYDSKVTKEIDNNPPLEFFESLTLKKDEAKKKWQIENSPDTTKKEQKAVEVDAPAKSSIRGSNDIRVPEVANESSISGEQYTVQVASLKELDRAESLTRSLIGKGIDAYYLEANVNGKTYYRIRCGKFSDRNEAETYAQKIEADSGLKGFVSKVE